MKQKTNKNLWGHVATPGPCSTEGPSTSSKYAGLGAALAAELIVGFWFAVGAILAIKMVKSLEELISRNKMAEEQQVTKEPQQVTTKNPNKVKAGKRLAEYNRRKREEKKAQSEASELNQYYGIGAVLAVGVIGGLGYYIIKPRKEWQLLTAERSRAEKYQIILLNHALRITTSKCSLYYKNGQEEYSK